MLKRVIKLIKYFFSKKPIIHYVKNVYRGGEEDGCTGRNKKRN